MELAELVTALADEIDAMQPHLSTLLQQLAHLTVDDEHFIRLLDQYNAYSQHMGEAAEIVGFTGLQALCNQVQENTLLLAALSPNERQPLLTFLYHWPSLMSHYLRHLHDETTASGLVDSFVQAPAPFTDVQAADIRHQLANMAEAVAQGTVFFDPNSQRQTIAHDDDVTLNVPADVDPRLMEGFLQESPEMAMTLVTWAQGIADGEPLDLEALKTAKRIVHTLKGTGAIIGLKGLMSLGHHFEDILDYIEEQPGQLSPPIKAIILDVAYCLEQMIAYIAGNDSYPEQALGVLQQVLDIANKIDIGVDLAEASTEPPPAHAKVDDRRTPGQTLPDASANTDPPALTPTATTTATTQSQTNLKTDINTRTDNAHPPADNNTAALRVSLNKIDDLFRLSGEITTHASAMAAAMKEITDHTQALLQQQLILQKWLFELETLIDVRAFSLRQGHLQTVDNPSNDFDPLEMDQYNELHGTTHALGEALADARLMAHRIDSKLTDFTSLQSRQELLAKELQHLIMGTRMAPVGNLEPRLQRNVHITSQATNKLAKLTMTGKDTLIDSNLLSDLAEPLLHLLRNAIDHGIESSEERQQKGKPPVGRVQLDVRRQGQQIVLICEDDGSGIDTAKVYQKALAAGLVHDNDNQPLSDDEIAQLIFNPGLTLTETVSQISGRGVGLDVVKHWVTTRNGTVRVATGEAGGCRFELRFAASLSTMHALIVSVAGGLFALPSIQIEQAVPHSMGQFGFIDNHLRYQFDNQVMPAHFLAHLTGFKVDADKSPSDYHAVIVTINNQRLALAVDELLDARELLVKSAGRYARHLVGVAGLANLGNGPIVVNLDLTQLLHHLSHQQANQQQVTQQQAGQANIVSTHAITPQRPQAVPKILVVDDALTVRNSLQQLIEDWGYQTQTARDGLEAINVLTHFHPNVVVTDLEMPNINGIELTNHIRNRTDTQDLPIVMITSRSQEKHRKLAERAGVTSYMTKPYNDIDLITTIKNLLK